MSAKHTPGPWLYRRLDEWTHTVVTNHGELPNGDPNDWAIASINIQREEAADNARLFAAAPDLLEVLNAITDFCDDPQGSDKGESLAMGLARLLPAARAAIKKATGE